MQCEATKALALQVSGCECEHHTSTCAQCSVCQEKMTNGEDDPRSIMAQFAVDRSTGILSIGETQLACEKVHSEEVMIPEQTPPEYIALTNPRRLVVPSDPVRNPV